MVAFVSLQLNTIQQLIDILNTVLLTYFILTCADFCILVEHGKYFDDTNVHVASFNM